MYLQPGKTQHTILIQRMMLVSQKSIRLLPTLSVFVSWWTNLSSVLREEPKVKPLLVCIERSQLRWGMPPGRLPRGVFQALPAGWRPQGFRWRDLYVYAGLGTGRGGRGDKRQIILFLLLSTISSHVNRLTTIIFKLKHNRTSCQGLKQRIRSIGGNTARHAWVCVQPTAAYILCM